MKTATMSATVLMLAFLIGCSEQQPVSAPVSEVQHSTAQLGKASYNGLVPIDLKVVGPLGITYHVTGAIPYSFQVNDNIYVLQTSVNLAINEPQKGMSWVAVGGKRFSSPLDAEGVVSENIGFQSGNVYSSYMLRIEYSVKPDGVTVSSLEILDEMLPIWDSK